MTAFINNRFVQYDEAVLHVSDLSMQRGYALFDFFRTVNGKPLFMEHHIQRFFDSAKAMHLQVPYGKEELIHIIDQLIKKSVFKEAGVRLLLTGGYSSDTYHTAAPNLIISCNAVKTSSADMFQKGITAISYSFTRELPHIKSINYLTAVWLHPLLKERGADDVLYHNDGIVSEFPRANVFAVINNRLVTPARQMLQGITRRYVLEQAAAFMEVEERDLSLQELYHATEVFLTSTTRRVMPVTKLDDVVYNHSQPGEVSKRLWTVFKEMENGF